MTVLRAAVLLVLAATLRAQDVVQPIDLSLKDLRGILIEADSGHLELKASNLPKLRGEVRFSLPSGAKRQDFAALTAVEGSTLVIRSARLGASSIPVQLALDVPTGVSVSVIGHALSVRAEGFESPLKIRTLSGNVEILDPIGPVNVDADTGNIIVTLRVQPKGDMYFHTDSGLIKCTLDEGVSLKTILRSEAMLSWGAGVETFQGSLERVLGSGGPLMYASSSTNKVSVALTPSILPSSSAISGPVFRVNANWVYMNVIVKDQMEQTIPNLRRESFNVFDNGLPVDLRHFESTTEPFHVLLLFDVSGSIKPHATLIREAARQFIRRAHNGDEFAVATFSSTSRLVQPFTANLELAEKALNGITPGGGTAIYDAVQTSIREYMKGTTGRKAIVLFTDGVDNSLWGGEFGSTHPFNDLLTSVKATDCLIYPIFVQPVVESKSQVRSPSNAKPNSIAELLANVTGSHPKLDCVQETNPRGTPFPCPIDPYQVIAAGENNLRELADQTGGRFYTLRQMADLASTYSQISADLSTVYTLGFPVRLTGSKEWHQLTVRVRDFPLAIVRTRSGYFSGIKEE